MPPGHPPLRDIDLDIDALKVQWADREEVLEPVTVEAPTRRAHTHKH